MEYACVSMYFSRMAASAARQPSSAMGARKASARFFLASLRLAAARAAPVGGSAAAAAAVFCFLGAGLKKALMEACFLDILTKPEPRPATSAAESSADVGRGPGSSKDAEMRQPTPAAGNASEGSRSSGNVDSMAWTESEINDLKESLRDLDDQAQILEIIKVVVPRVMDFVDRYLSEGLAQNDLAEEIVLLMLSDGQPELFRIMSNHDLFAVAIHQYVDLASDLALETRRRREEEIAEAEARAEAEKLAAEEPEEVADEAEDKLQAEANAEEVEDKKPVVCQRATCRSGYKTTFGASLLRGGGFRGGMRKLATEAMDVEEVKILATDYDRIIDNSKTPAIERSKLPAKENVNKTLSSECLTHRECKCD